MGFAVILFASQYLRNASMQCVSQGQQAAKESCQLKIDSQVITNNLSYDKP